MNHWKFRTLLLIFFCFTFFQFINANDDTTSRWRDPQTNSEIYWNITDWTAGCARIYQDSSKDWWIFLYDFREDWGCPDSIEIPNKIYNEDVDSYFDVIWIFWGNNYWGNYHETKYRTIKFDSIKIPSSINFIHWSIEADYLEINLKWDGLNTLYKNVSHWYYSRGNDYFGNDDLMNIYAEHLHINSENWYIDGCLLADTNKLTFWSNTKSIALRCTNVKNMILPDSVETIKWFWSGSYYEWIEKKYWFNVKFWNWIKYIWNDIFRGMNKVSWATDSEILEWNSYFEIPDSVEYIWDGAFAQNYYKSIKIWKKLNHVWKWAFCSWLPHFNEKTTPKEEYNKITKYLESVYCDKNWKVWVKVENPGNVSDGLKNQLYDACLYIEDDLPNGLTKCLSSLDAESNNNQNSNKNNDTQYNSHENKTRNNNSNETITEKKSDENNTSQNTNSSWNNCSIKNSSYWQEENNAFLFACENEIISTKNIQDANLSNPITRWEMASIMSLYAINVLGKEPDESKICDFNDIHMEFTTESMEIYLWIKKACRLWLMWVWITDFNQDWKVSRAEFWTVMSRLLRWDKYNNVWKNWYDWHLNALQNNGIITNINPNLTEHKLWVLLQLYRNSEKTNEEKKRHDEYYASQWTPLWFTL